MKKNSLTKQTRSLGTVQVFSKIRGIFLPEEEKAGEYIKERRRNRLKVSSILINTNMMRHIINSY